MSCGEWTFSQASLCVSKRDRKESVATYPFAPAGATALSLCTVIHFWNWDMDLNSYSPVLQKARQFALDGDYMSAQSYYEETKSHLWKKIRNA